MLVYVKMILYFCGDLTDEYMASSRTLIMNKEIKINNKQIVSKMPDTAICYIHC